MTSDFDAVDIGIGIDYTTDFTVENGSLFLLGASTAAAGAHLAAHVTVALRNTMLTRIRAEYLEMPGLRLKAAEMQRLCGVERTMCQVVLDLLVDEKFLCVRSDGRYARLTTGHHPHPTKADLTADKCAKKAT
jgi:hypothetical protein